MSSPDSLLLDCTFCAIADGRAEASIVYSDDQVLAFMDTNPVTEGHVLVIPRRHYACLPDLDEATGAHLFRAALRVQRAIRASDLRCEGINLFLADGEAAGQEVFHVHLHVFPRYSGDSFRIKADWSNYPARSELEALAQRLRSQMPG